MFYSYHVQNRIIDNRQSSVNSFPINGNYKDVKKNDSLYTWTCFSMTKMTTFSYSMYSFLQY